MLKVHGSWEILSQLIFALQLTICIIYVVGPWFFGDSGPANSCPTVSHQDEMARLEDFYQTQADFHQGEIQPDISYNFKYLYKTCKITNNFVVRK